MAKRKAFAPDGSSGKGKSLPGMSDVVQAIPICAVPVFPRFAPGDAGQNENKRGRGVDKFLAKFSNGPLFCHVGRRTVMIEAVEPIGEAMGIEVKFSWVQIAGRRINAQCVCGSG